MVDVNFFKPFIEGTIHTLEVQCEFKSSPGKPFIKETNEPRVFDIAAVIGLNSKVFNGTITLCFPSSVFLKIMSNMLGEECTEITEELEDGASELLNIIFGHAKKILNDNEDYAIEKAIPTVVTGKGISTMPMRGSKIVAIPFESSEGSFQIEICSEQNFSVE